MVYNLKILVTSLTNYSIAEVRCCLSEAFHCLQSLKMCFEENLDKERCHIVGKWLYKGRSVYLNLKKKKISNDHCSHWMTLKMWSFLEGDLKKNKKTQTPHALILAEGLHKFSKHLEKNREKERQKGFYK